MVRTTKNDVHSDEHQEQIQDRDETFGYEGGKIVLAVPSVYHFDKGDVEVPYRLIIQGEKKTAVEIRTTQGYDALLKVLQSSKGRKFRSHLSQNLSINDLDVADIQS